MLKWFENAEPNFPNLLCSRIRLVRNWDGYQFPSRLDDKQALEMIRQIETGLSYLGEMDGNTYEYTFLNELNELERRALRDRRILNTAILEKKAPVGIILSEDEKTSLILNGSDHFRIQKIGAGLLLEELWKEIDKLDDYVNRMFPYAFDEKYGYLTSYPTNVGTGMRASVVIHLPTLSLAKKFNRLIGEMGRFGVTVRSVYGGDTNYGALYEVVNQKTLGITEKEIIELVAKVALQLNSQELQVREMSLKKHRLEREDEVYKSYGVLKYARRLSRKDAMTFLSQLMAGQSDGLLLTREPCSFYRLMLGIQSASLQKLSDRPLNGEELDAARAAYIRRELPEIK